MHTHAHTQHKRTHMQACTIPGLDAPLERLMASAFRGLASVLIVWVLRMYLATFIILIYSGLNQYAKHMPAVPQVRVCMVSLRMHTFMFACACMSVRACDQCTRR
jgi:hypothetical protein